MEKRSFPLKQYCSPAISRLLKTTWPKRRGKLKIPYDPSMPSWIKHYFSTVKNQYVLNMLLSTGEKFFKILWLTNLQINASLQKKKNNNTWQYHFSSSFGKTLCFQHFQHWQSCMETGTFIRCLWKYKLAWFYWKVIWQHVSKGLNTWNTFKLWNLLVREYPKEATRNGNEYKAISTFLVT